MRDSITINQWIKRVSGWTQEHNYGLNPNNTPDEWILLGFCPKKIIYTPISICSTRPIKGDKNIVSHVSVFIIACFVKIIVVKT